MKWENNVNGSFWKLRFEQLSSRKSLKRNKVAHGQGGLRQCTTSDLTAVGSLPSTAVRSKKEEEEIFLDKIPLPVMILLLTQFNTNDFEALFQTKCRPVLVDGKQSSSHVTELLMFHWDVDGTKSDNIWDDRWMNNKENPLLSTTAVQALFTIGCLAFDYLVSSKCLSGKTEDYHFVPGIEKTINVQNHPEIYWMARDNNNNKNDASTVGRDIFSIILPLHVEGSLLRLICLETGEQRFIYIPFGKFVVVNSSRYACGHGYGQSPGNRCILGLIIPKEPIEWRCILMGHHIDTIPTESPQEVWEKTAKRVDKCSSKKYARAMDFPGCALLDNLR
ncbi:unnamed protein product [Cylindrotheca closterium]|uniref:Uncharacterized protein n=1 Tax=Cylindrotheca closterium TaxID=2856 RepID=A0AAD2FEB2_9STRA|nr:unnamed protein product [Cylindrotheca closterium]